MDKTEYESLKWVMAIVALFGIIMIIIGYSMYDYKEARIEEIGEEVYGQEYHSRNDDAVALIGVGVFIVLIGAIASGYSIQKIKEAESKTRLHQYLKKG